MTNLNLNNISVTTKMVKGAIMNLDLRKGYGAKCIPVVLLKNCEIELSNILAEIFNISLISLMNVGRSHRWPLYLRMLGKGLQLQTIALLVSFLWLVKPLKNL